jgi:hypothetical protein
MPKYHVNLQRLRRAKKQMISKPRLEPTSLDYEGGMMFVVRP